MNKMLFPYFWEGQKWPQTEKGMGGEREKAGKE